MHNVNCEICNEIVDLDSDELSDNAAANKVHQECLGAYFDFIELKAEKSEMDYPTKEMIMLAKIFNENKDILRRRTKAFGRILNKTAIFKYKRI